MPPQRSVFYGFGAWVGQQITATKCAFWTEDPSGPLIHFNNAMTVTVDLDKNPYAVRANRIQIADIQVDDRPSDGGLTKIGPTFPSGSTINGCWMEQTHYDALAGHGFQPARRLSYAQCRDYELTTVLYWSGPQQSHRYWGFHAEITAVQPPRALVTIWPAGQSQAQHVTPAGTWWLDLTTDAHPIEPGFTAIGCGPNDARVGALFLDARTVRNLQLEGPKLPTYAGGHFFPQSAR